MKIIIGSVLKPLDDVRHYAKIAHSLSGLENAHIYIAARATAYPLPAPSLPCEFYALIPARFNLLQRWLAPWRFLIYIFKVKPEAIIVNTHELLLVMVLYRILFGAKTIYDIQENYALNVLCNRTYPVGLKHMLAWGIRFKEKCCAKWIDRFWLAEACYESQLCFTAGRSDLLENKSLFARPAERIALKGTQPLTLLYSGTVALENGICEALSLVHQLHLLDDCYQMVVIGCCHTDSLRQELQVYASQNTTWLRLEVSDTPVSYTTILKEMQNASVGLVCYWQQLNFTSKMPTKLFEYTSSGLVILCQKEPVWKAYCDSFDNGISLNFEAPHVAEIHQQLQSRTFYTNGNKDSFSTCWGIAEQLIIRKSLLQNYIMN